MESVISSRAKKIIVVSDSNYGNQYGDILVYLLKRKIELFCIVGTDSSKWEEALDFMCIQDKSLGVDFVYTMSNLREKLEEVIDFASKWPIEGLNKVQIIKI